MRAREMLRKLARGTTEEVGSGRASMRLSNSFQNRAASMASVPPRTRRIPASYDQLLSEARPGFGHTRIPEASAWTWISVTEGALKPRPAESRMAPGAAFHDSPAWGLKLGLRVRRDSVVSG